MVEQDHRMFSYHENFIIQEVHAYVGIYGINFLSFF